MSKAGTVLVVDDEKAVCDMLNKFLTKQGYKVFIALSGMEALKIVKDKHPQVILLDIKMPEMNGLVALQKIKELDKKAGVVMITAVKDEEIGKKCMALGAYDYVTKPFGLEYLENVLMAKLLELKT